MLDRILSNSWLKLGLAYFAILFLVYSPVLVNNYALLDDYQFLYSALTLGTLPSLSWDIGEGRPLFGLFRWFAVENIHSIGSFRFFRLFSFFSLFAFSLFLYWFLKKREIFTGKTFLFLFPLLIALLPSAQVQVAWATISTYITACLLSGIAYSLVSCKRIKNIPLKATLASLVLIASFAIFQPSGMFFLFFLFLDLFVKKQKLEFKSFVLPAIVLCIGMIASLFLVKVFPQLVLGPDFHNGRAEFSSSFLQKILWFAVPVSYSLQIYNVYWSPWIALVGLALFLKGLFSLPFYSTKDRYVRWFLIFGLLIFSYFPSMVVQDNQATYRTIFTLSATIATISFFGAYQLFLSSKKLFDNRYYWLGMGGIFLILFVQTGLYKGFVETSQGEYQAVKQAISTIPDDFEGQIYFDTPNMDVLSHGEFYYVTLKFNWALASMALSALRELGKKETLLKKEGSHALSYEQESTPVQDRYVISVLNLFELVYPHRERESSFKAKIKAFFSELKK